MKKILLIILFFSVSFFVKAQCDYTIELSDAWGDGWNGGTIDVLLDGSEVLTDITISDGYNDSFSFTVNEGQDLTTNYEEGSWGYENGYRILDSFGNVLFSSNYETDNAPPDNVTTGTITTSCIEATPPDCATTPSPFDGATDIPAGDITFTWTAPATGPTPTSYNIYAYDDASGTNPQLITNVPTESADLTILAYDVTIFWAAIPLNGPVEATGCAVWSFTTEVPPGYCLNAPYGQWPSSTAGYTPATCDGITSNNVTTVGYAGEYSLINVTSGQTYQFNSSVATDFITISDAAGATPYAYAEGSVTWTSTIDGQVRFYTHLSDQCEDEDTNRTRSILCGPTLTTEEFDAESLFSYYPNPVSNTLTLNAQRNIQSVSVMNMLGQEVLRATPNTVNSILDMTNLTAGSYFVNVTVEGVSKTVRIIKN